MNAVPENIWIRVDPELADLVTLGVVVMRGVEVALASEVLDEEIRRHCRTVRERFGSAKSSEVPGAADARRLYKDFGIDPTKTRPSSEALLRRVLKGEELYRINTLVDAINLVSLRAQLPFGLYDLSQVKPPVVLRRGRPSEQYEGIRKGPVHVEGRPVLADAQGPFGNPTSDSARTMITLANRDALIIVYAPHGYAATRLNGVLDDTIDLVRRTCGGSVEARLVIRIDRT